MADIKVRNLDETVARALRTCAKARGLSLEEEVRRSLAESIAVKQDAFARRAAACRAATRRTRTRPPSDSAALIRRERDTRG
jgi:plasmid stability protein